MSRRRNPENAGLPANLTVNGKYFKYRNPITGKSKSWNVSRAEAITAARILNEKLASVVAQKLVDGVLRRKTKSHSVKDVITGFRLEWLPEKNLKDSTLHNMEFKLAKYEREIGNKVFPELNVADLRVYFQALSKSAYVKHRQLWIELYRYAISVGIVPIGHNVAEATMLKTEPPRRRMRLTLEQFRAIRGKAPDWLQIAMDFSLLSLQPREIAAVVRLSDLQNGFMRVIRGKTGDHIEIECGSGVLEVFERARRTGIASPFVVHRLPKRRRRADMNAREHWTQVMPDYISRAFKRAAEATGLFDDIPRDIWPTFHELRSLGGILYKKAGYTKEQINLLRGHESDKMFDLYEEGHGIVWKKATAGLVL